MADESKAYEKEELLEEELEQLAGGVKAENNGVRAVEDDIRAIADETSKDADGLWW